MICRNWAATSRSTPASPRRARRVLRDPPLLQSLLGDHELHLVSRWYSGRLLERSVAEELVAIEPHRALLATMGSAVLVYAETSGGIAGTEPGRYRADRAYRMGTGAISASASPSLPTV